MELLGLDVGGVELVVGVEIGVSMLLRGVGCGRRRIGGRAAIGGIVHGGEMEQGVESRVVCDGGIDEFLSDRQSNLKNVGDRSTVERYVVHTNLCLGLVWCDVLGR